jgi:hypothetical protein
MHMRFHAVLCFLRQSTAGQSCPTPAPCTIRGVRCRTVPDTHHGIRCDQFQYQLNKKGLAPFNRRCALLWPDCKHDNNCRL